MVMGLEARWSGFWGRKAGSGQAGGLRRGIEEDEGRPQKANTPGKGEECVWSSCKGSVRRVVGGGQGDPSRCLVATVHGWDLMGRALGSPRRVSTRCRPGLGSWEVRGGWFSGRLLHLRQGWC